MKRLDNKVAIVTGASKGIGAGIAKAFGAEGAAVVVNYARDHEGAERVVREITGKGGRAIAVQGDVAQRSDAQRLVAEAKKAFGRLDVLVNNAGVFSFAPFEQFSEQEFHRQFNTNVLGTFLMIEAALPAFGAEGGSIINIGSTESVAADPTLSIYVPAPSTSCRRHRTRSGRLGWHAIQSMPQSRPDRRLDRPAARLVPRRTGHAPPADRQPRSGLEISCRRCAATDPSARRAAICTSAPREVSAHTAARAAPPAPSTTARAFPQRY